MKFYVSSAPGGCLRVSFFLAHPTSWGDLAKSEAWKQMVAYAVRLDGPGPTAADYMPDIEEELQIELDRITAERDTLKVRLRRQIILYWTLWVASIIGALPHWLALFKI